MASVSAGLPSGSAANVAGAARQPARLSRWARIEAGSLSIAVRSERRNVGNECSGGEDADEPSGAASVAIPFVVGLVLVVAFAAASAAASDATVATASGDICKGTDGEIKRGLELARAAVGEQTDVAAVEVDSIEVDDARLESDWTCSRGGRLGSTAPTGSGAYGHSESCCR